MPGKESTPPFQSKLTPYRNEILKAWFRRQTLREIQAMLQKHGVTNLPAGNFPFHQAAQEQIRSESRTAEETGADSKSLTFFGKTEGTVAGIREGAGS